MKENDYLKKIISKKSFSGLEYDYLVMFSGGKDSTYLADYMKKMPGGRVLCLAINNGYEQDYFETHVSEVAKLIECDLKIIRHDSNDFLQFYQKAILNPEYKKYDSNPICYLCGQYLITIAMNYADENRIPFVVHGCSPSQFNKNMIKKFSQYQGQNEQYINLVEKSSRLMHSRLRAAQKDFLTNDVYGLSEEHIRLFKKWHSTEHRAKIIYPFLYLDYNVERILLELEQKFGWKNGAGISSNRYITSGCKISNLFEALQDVGIIEIHENDEFKNDMINKKMSFKRFLCNYRPHFCLRKKKCNLSVENKKLAQELGIDHIFSTNNIKKKT